MYPFNSSGNCSVIILYKNIFPTTKCIFPFDSGSDEKNVFNIFLVKPSSKTL